jgi:hypothetical protein
MTYPEFSNEFDVLYNNISSNQAPGLDDYEKSVFLNKAKDEIVVSLYNGNNLLNKSFEGNEELRSYLKNLIVSNSVTPIVETPENSHSLPKRFSANSKLFKVLDSAMLFTTYESATINNNKEIIVIPTTQDEVNRVLKNPFRKPSSDRVLRLDSGNGYVELISSEDITHYNIKGLNYPTEFPEDLSSQKEYSLHPALHRVILQRAVELALASMHLNTNNN